LKGHEFIRAENSKILGRASQAAEKLNEEPNSQGFVTGHDFSRADKSNQIDAGLQPLQKPIPPGSLYSAFFRNLFSPWLSSTAHKIPVPLPPTHSLANTNRTHTNPPTR
jgi:hypothetical protein